MSRRGLPFALAVAFVAAVLLAGCSGALRIVYDNADAFVRWKADNYVRLAGADSEELDERIDSFFDWHRAKALPKYAAIAHEGAKRVARGLSQEDLVWGYDSLVANGTEGLRAAAERLAPLLDRVGPEQIRNIERGFAEDNRRFAKDYLRGTEEERRRRRVKRMVERIEDFVGRLSDAQLARVEEFAKRVPQSDELRDRDRRRLQAGLLEIVRQQKAGARLADYAANWQKGRDPAYAASSEHFRKELFALTLDLDRMLTAEQRARAVAKLQRYGEDFAALAAARERRAPQ